LCQFSYTKADRILKRADFIRLSKCGKKFYCRYFIAAVSPGLSAGNRLGVTVTKKVGKAATRNRIKRLAREYFRLNKHRLAGIWDINIIAKKEATAISSSQVFSCLQELFEKISRNFGR
jgi:ribonuclease P protein component